MNYKQRAACYREMAAYTDKDAYISDLALSPLWGDSDGAEIPQKRISDLAQLWDDAHMTIPEIAKIFGLTITGMSDRFLIPMGTLKKWMYGHGDPAKYITLLLMEIARHDGEYRLTCYQDK